MDIIREIIVDGIEALLILSIFGALQDNKKYVFENKLRTILFCIFYIFANYWSKFYVPLVYHTIFVIIFSILLLAFVTKINALSAIVTYSLFLIIVAITETATMIIEMLVLKTDVNGVTLIWNNLIVFTIISKSLQILIVGIFLKYHLHLKKSNLLKRDSSLITTGIIQIAIFGIFIFCASASIADNKNIAAYNVLILAVYFVFFSMGLIDLKEKERILRINSKFKIQESQVKNMEEIIEIIRQEKHDFANHINVIQGLCSLDKPNSIHRIKEYVSEISNNLHSSFKYLDTGNDYMDGLLSIKSNYALKSNIDFKVKIGESFKSLTIKSDELVSIISNLVDNAFDILENKEGNKEISITTFMKEDKFCIEVADNGESISNDMKDKIFERGFSTKNSEKKGHGYGLFITKQLVEENNGYIYVYSVPEQTKFVVKF